MPEEKIVKVFIRRIGTNEIVKEVDVTSVIGTSNYFRTLSGMERCSDMARFWIDSVDADAIQEADYSKQGREMP